MEGTCILPRPLSWLCWPWSPSCLGLSLPMNAHQGAPCHTGSWKPGPVQHHGSDPPPRGQPGTRLVKPRKLRQRGPADSTLLSGSDLSAIKYFGDHQVQLQFRHKPPCSAPYDMPLGTGSSLPYLAPHSIWGKFSFSERVSPRSAIYHPL